LIIERRVHPEKQFSKTTSTDDGMQIDESDEQFENASRPIRDNAEPDSNVTEPRLLQSQKQLSPSSATDEGIQISESDEQTQNAFIPIHK
jgi:hypothetical protein